MGANMPLNQINSNLPNMENALISWYVPMVFEVVTKETIGGRVVETTTPVNFHGVMQPLTTAKLMLRPEGQRTWKWFLMHCDTSLKLNTDDVVIYKGVQTRVMGVKDYSDYGYLEYELCQDWTGVGPSVVTP
jgi:hypothetical protein